jgi:hypothetical protein
VDQTNTTQTPCSEVASKLGVDRSTVTKVVKNVNGHIIYHDRIKAREYYEKNPDDLGVMNNTQREWGAVDPGLILLEWGNNVFTSSLCRAR